MSLVHDCIVNDTVPHAELPCGLSRKKAHEASPSYAQKEAQNFHSQRISYIQVAVSNATLLAFRH